MYCCWLQWERVKKAGMAPSPARASFGMACHGDSTYVFGGVTDQKGRKDAVYSELYNDMYTFGLKCRRWYPLQMKLKPAAAAVQVSSYCCVLATPCC